MRKIVIMIVVGLLVAGLAVGLVVSRAKKTAGSAAVDTPVYAREAEKAVAGGNLLEARKLYRGALEDPKNNPRLPEIKKRLEELNLAVLFSPAMDECSVACQVEGGDNLFKIAKKYDTTVALIKRANSLTTDAIRPGQQLKVNTCRFSILVNKTANILMLKVKDSDEVLKTYVVSTGKGGSTPAGNFKITNKLVDPVWYKTGAVISPDSPENVLGTRWMGLDAAGYGIHGTTAPQDLGKQVTLGCVRMLNFDAEELYDIVPVGTEVTIVE